MIFTLGFVSAANESYDNLTLSDSKVSSFDDIQLEVNKAHENDVINLEGYYESSGKQISLTKSLTFSGSNNTVLDAKSSSNIFYAPKPVSLTFKNIIFLNSNDFAVKSNTKYSNFNIHIINCTFKNNHYLAVDSYGANLVVENCLFENNYQAIQDYMHPVIIDNCNFIKNSYVAIQTGDTAISKSSFIANGNKKDGLGAIQSNSLNITDSVFLNNHAYEAGSAINAYDIGNISVCNSSFINNTAKYLGGAIYLENNHLYLNQCIFSGNQAFNGAAIYSIKSQLDIRNSNFTDNHADYSVIYSKAKSSFNNILFKDNSKYTVIASKANLINCNNLSKSFSQWCCINDNLNNSDFIRIALNKISTYYKSGKELKVRLINTGNNSAVSKCKVKVVLKAGKKTYTKYMTTDKDGFASFDISKYKVERYNLFVSVVDSKFASISLKEIDTALIFEAHPIVKAPKVKFKYKKSKYFKVIVKHQKTKKGIKKIKLKLKVYTGKKYKIYKIKTNNKSIAKLNTKKLKRGTHKVIITSLNKNYYINKKSSIIIK